MRIVNIVRSPIHMQQVCLELKPEKQRKQSSGAFYIQLLKITFYAQVMLTCTLFAGRIVTEGMEA